MNNKQAQG